jgi:hypothetical protein
MVVQLKLLKLKVLFMKEPGNQIMLPLLFLILLVEELKVVHQLKLQANLF